MAKLRIIPKTTLKKEKKKKKKSRYEKGNDTEDEYETIKRNDGWITHIRPPRTNRWDKNKDIYNLFDLLGLKAEGTLLSQIKLGQNRAAVNEIRAWAIKNKDNLPPNLTIEVAVKKHATKRKIGRWRIYIISPDEKMPVTHYDRSSITKEV